MVEGERSFDVATDATLRAALARRVQNGETGTFDVKVCDIRKKIFRRPGKSLIIFVVDASDSMGRGAHARMKAAKGAALAILAKARKKRHRVGMVAFMDESAEAVLRPTSSLTLARKCLKSLPAGGATPFADGLMKAWKMVKNERLKDPGTRPLLVVISDGEANVPYDSGRKLWEVTDELLVIAGRIGRDNIRSIAIDTRPPMEKSDDMRMIAKALGGSYRHINQLQARHVVDALTVAE